MKVLTLGRTKQTQIMNEKKQGAITELSVNELLTRYRNGDEGAFHEVVNRHKKLLYTFLQRVIDDLKVIDDVFQETFLQLYLGRDRFDTDYHLRTWLITVAANRAKDVLQKTHRQSAASRVPSPKRGIDGDNGMPADLPTLNPASLS